MWKNIKGYTGVYQVNEQGEVRSLKFGKVRILKPFDNGCGYLLVRLSKNGKTKAYTVHRLVAEAFIPNPNNLPEINHKDENKLNNHVSNLEYCSVQYNRNYGTRNERIAESLSKTVKQYTLNHQLVCVWPSTHEIERTLGYYQGNISSACNGRLLTAYGYRWSYN